MSKANFFRVFKQKFGLSPIDYIIKAWMRLAKRWLQNPSATPAGGGMAADAVSQALPTKPCAQYHRDLFQGQLQQLSLFHSYVPAVGENDL